MGRWLFGIVIVMAVAGCGHKKPTVTLKPQEFYRPQTRPAQAEPPPAQASPTPAAYARRQR